LATQNVWTGPLIWQVILSVSLTGFVLIGFDKGIAPSASLRVPEIVFYALCLFGGSLGVVLAMYLFRHKTKKPKFQLLVGGILLLQCMGFALLRKYGLT
jgi:uncharacterized membrane protein YsdA (DUF1294 family)